MTIEELQRIVRVLSNSCYVRWWAHWNHPQSSPWLIAFAAMDDNGAPINLYAPDVAKFSKVYLDSRIYYTVERLNADGAPFRIEY